MKQFILIVALFFSMVGHAQKFKFKTDGTTEFIVAAADSMSAAKLYARTLKWVDKNYTNPTDAIKAQSLDKMLRIDGVLQSAFTVALDTGERDYNASYSLEIHYKYGKYRVKYFHHAIVVDGERPQFKLSDILNETPDPKDKHWINHKKQYELKVQKLLNSLNQFLTRR